MIVGKGMLAKSLQKIDNDRFIFFCSGVSNSKETDELEYDREKKLLQNYYCNDKCLVYFSSYFVGYPEYLKIRYYRHKYEMENQVINNFRYYKIFRLPQVVGYSINKNTLTNFLFNSIANDIEINIYENVKRNLIDVEDIIKILEYVNQNNIFLNKTMNLISTQNFNIIDIVNTFEKILNKKSIKKFIKNDEKHFIVNISSELQKIYNILNIKFDENYLNNLINKYYGRSDG